MQAPHLSPHNWIRLRRSAQIISLLLFLLLFIAMARVPESNASTLFQRLDPLTALTASVAGRTLVAGIWLALLTLLLTLTFGRVWCGWICPLGTLLDWITPGQKGTKKRGSFLKAAPESWRRAKYLLLLIILFAALLGNQTLIFLDPITLLSRTLGSALWPALGYAIYQAEALLYGFEFLWPPLDSLHQNILYPLFGEGEFFYLYVAPIMLLFGALFVLNWWAPRFWCRYLCPLGGLLGLVARFALVRREVSEACTSCAHCLHSCPTGTIDARAEYRSDPAECIVCYDCLLDCPQEGVAFRLQRRWRPAPGYAYDPGRRQVVASLGVAAIGVSLAGVEPTTQHIPATLLRPPGTDGNALASLCLRCGACIRACPTHALQPGLLEGGWQNLFTPQLVPRLGYCLYECNACSQVCPVAAIPLFSPQEKQEKQELTIGLARVDRDRCLPWAYDTPCIVCEEMCPLPDKAIGLEEVQVVNSQGEEMTLQRPSVLQERCIGCGICEYKCPMGGAAAIRVYAQPQELA